jgi:hypothetical protein
MRFRIGSLRLRPGDVVARLFGTQLMTVESDDGLLVRCVWHDCGDLHRQPFMRSSLRRTGRYDR